MHSILSGLERVVICMKFSPKWVHLSIVCSISGLSGILLSYLWHVLLGHNSMKETYLWIVALLISVVFIILGIGIIPLMKLRCPNCGKSTPKLRWKGTFGICPGCGTSLECHFQK